MPAAYTYTCIHLYVDFRIDSKGWLGNANQVLLYALVQVLDKQQQTKKIQNTYAECVSNLLLVSFCCADSTIRFSIVRESVDKCVGMCLLVHLSGICSTLG